MQEVPGKPSPYSGCQVVLTTKHKKIHAIRPAFAEILSAEVVECDVDTDQLGTFSGEVEREGTAFECAGRKCEWGMKLVGADYAIASEGSFGPHPSVPFFPCDHEILYFIDARRGLRLQESLLTEKTNYRMTSTATREELNLFAEKAGFPAHALIVRPNVWRDQSVIFKGIQSQEALCHAFETSISHSEDGAAWVETDMRAHMNPTRMEVIAETARKLCRRLAAQCPGCEAPGWGIVRVERGLQCESCNLPTKLISHEIYGCVLCDHTDRTPRSDGQKTASPTYCSWCNP